MYLNSRDSLSTRPTNTWHDFTSDFIPELVLEENCSLGLRVCEWSFALVELSITSDDEAIELTLPDSVAVLCDLARESHIKSVTRPVLRTIPAATAASTSLGQIFYIDVNRHRFTSLAIKILTRELTPIPADKTWPSDQCHLTCTLHFIRS